MDGTGNLSNTVENIDPEELQAILAGLANDQNTISEATGTLRANLKQVLDDKGWNKVALSMIRKIDAKSETARADMLRTFVPMFDAMMKTKWRAEMNDLIDGAEGDTDPIGD